jgi:hypothetical protein
LKLGLLRAILFQSIIQVYFNFQSSVTSKSKLLVASRKTLFGLFGNGIFELKSATGGLEFIYIILVSISVCQDGSTTFILTLNFPLFLKTYVKRVPAFLNITLSLFKSIISQE